MRSFRRLLPTFAAFSFAALIAASTASAQDRVNWRLNLDEGEKLAMQTNRLVLIHFWAPWCGPCRALETSVFAQPGVGAALESRFVPVKINLDDQAYSATARLYEIRSIPTDVIITPSGRLIARIPSSQDPRVYVAQLMRAAGDAAPTAIASASPPPSAYSQPSASTASDLTGASMYSSSTAYGGNSGSLPGPGGPSTASYSSPSYSPPPAATASTAPPLPARPPLGLDGYCPVTLIERHHQTPNDPHCWVQGDPRWGVVHRGIVYLFAGPEEQKRFLADPDRYSPALSGNDPVMAFDQGRLEMGSRQYGTFFGDRIYLFSSQENYRKFASNPDIARRYADEVRQAEAINHATMH